MIQRKLSINEQEDSDAENSQNLCLCSAPERERLERRSGARSSVSESSVGHLEGLQSVFEPLRKMENAAGEGEQMKIRMDGGTSSKKKKKNALDYKYEGGHSSRHQEQEESLFGRGFKTVDLAYGGDIYEEQRIHEVTDVGRMIQQAGNSNGSPLSFKSTSEASLEAFDESKEGDTDYGNSTRHQDYRRDRQFHDVGTAKDVASSDECLLHGNPDALVSEQAQDFEDYKQQQQQQQQHVSSSYHHRYHHHHHHQSSNASNLPAQPPVNYHSRLSTTKHSLTGNVSSSSSIGSYAFHPENSGSSNAGSPAGAYGNGKCTASPTSRFHRRHRHGNSAFAEVASTNHHHGTASNGQTATSSGSSLINCHLAESSGSTSPAVLVEEHRRDGSSSSTGNVRSHGQEEYFPEGHHHHRHHRHQNAQRMPTDNKPRDRLEHHGANGASIASVASPPSPLVPQHRSQYHVHGHAYNAKQPNQSTKNPAFIGINGIQVSMPSKSKCQCHALQEGCRNKRVSECGSDGNGEMTSIMHQPPALPPRPPPRPTRRYETTASDHGNVAEGDCCKKYVILCSLCGGLSATVGSLFLAIHAVLSAHTASLALFETVPSYIPGTMLIIMGFFTVLLARRKHRYGFLMKVCGSVGVVCALVCVLVTVTTTVVHMSRLQGLRECVYTARARSCTCYEAPQSKGDPGVLFEGTPHCEAVHGVLYACLRALFGVSVAGILACIFSCMLVYQLLSHEKKKMYWEQLELRYRSLYGQGTTPGVGSAVAGSCGCCNDCGGTGSWWAQTPGNLYTPNPDLAPSRRWRLPWSRSRGPAPSPDSNYGFHTQSRQTENNIDSAVGPYSVLSSQASGPYSVLTTQTSPYNPNSATYSVLETPVPLWGPPPPYSDPNSPARRLHIPESRSRIGKRIEIFDNNEDHRPRITNKRPSDNYENAEDLANSTDPEGGNEGTIKNRRTRKPLKGVENCAFQQEPNQIPKQSESELYFGDVSSCCGPESSFYDVALDKDVEQSESMDYLTVHLGKRQLSKRSRMPIPLSSETGNDPSNSYANNEESRNIKIPYLAPDAQYEVIQQGRYSYYTSKSDIEEDDKIRRREGSEEDKVNDGNCDDGSCNKRYFQVDSREKVVMDCRVNHHENDARPCCLNDTVDDSNWQNADQQNQHKQQQSNDNVHPVNV